MFVLDLRFLRSFQLCGQCSRIFAVGPVGFGVAVEIDTFLESSHNMCSKQNPMYGLWVDWTLQALGRLKPGGRKLFVDMCGHVETSRPQSRPRP